MRQDEPSLRVSRFPERLSGDASPYYRPRRCHLFRLFQWPTRSLSPRLPAFPVRSHLARHWARRAWSDLFSAARYHTLIEDRPPRVAKPRSTSRQLAGEMLVQDVIDRQHYDDLRGRPRNWPGADGIWRRRAGEARASWARESWQRPARLATSASLPRLLRVLLASGVPSQLPQPPPRAEFVA